VLFVNPRSGGGKAARAALAERARERGIEAVEFGADRSLAASVDEAVNGGADALGVAGGDGSLAIVAAAARAHGLPFVCVPAGTRNHFARDLGVDRRDLVGALDGFTDAVERRIDVAEVNGRLFLNNVSLGIYGDAVRQAAYRDAKLRTLLETVGAALGPSGRRAELHLVDDLGRDHHHPASLLVSNNSYAMEPPPRARRPFDARERAARDHRPRSAGRYAASSSTRLDCDIPRGGRAGGGARRGRWRGGRARSAAALRNPAGGAASQDRPARARSTAATAIGANAAPVTDPAITSPG
jgi:hypothetical protein